MLDKLKIVEERFEEINNNLNDPTVIGNQDLFRDLMKEYKNLEPIVLKYREYSGALNDEKYEQAKKSLEAFYKKRCERAEKEGA